MQMTQGGNFRHLRPFSRSGEGAKVVGVISLLVVIFKPIYFRLATVPLMMWIHLIKVSPKPKLQLRLLGAGVLFELLGPGRALALFVHLHA